MGPIRGLLIGAAAGAFIGYSDGDDPTCSGWGCPIFTRTHTASQKAAVGAVILGVGGAALLGTIFTSTKTKVVYRFTTPPTAAAPVIVEASE